MKKSEKIKLLIEIISSINSYTYTEETVRDFNFNWFNWVESLSKDISPKLQTLLYDVLESTND